MSDLFFEEKMRAATADYAEYGPEEQHGVNRYKRLDLDKMEGFIAGATWAQEELQNEIEQLIIELDKLKASLDAEIEIIACANCEKVERERDELKNLIAIKESRERSFESTVGSLIDQNKRLREACAEVIRNSHDILAKKECSRTIEFVDAEMENLCK